MKKYNNNNRYTIDNRGPSGDTVNAGGNTRIRRPGGSSISPGRGRGYVQVSSGRGIVKSRGRGGLLPHGDRPNFARISHIVDEHLGGVNNYRGDSEGWHKITVVFGTRYDKNWILESLQAKLNRSFTPFMWRVEQKNCFFYVQEKKSSAEEFKKVASDIVGPDNQKLIVNVVEVREPVVPLLDDEVKEKIKQVLSRRYLVATKALDLSLLKKDNDFVSVGLYLPLNKANVLSAVLELLSQSTLDLAVLNVSDNAIESLAPFGPLLQKLATNLSTIDLRRNRLKSIEDLSALSNCAELRCIRLEENPILGRNRPEFFSSLKSLCPKLVKVNERDVTAIGQQPGNTLPERTLGYFPNDDVRGAVLNYLKDYYTILDSSDRTKLMNFYTENATLTLSTASPQCTMKHKTLGCYISLSRNLLYLRNSSDKANGLVQRGKLQCVSALDKLPSTNHLLSSLRVDVADSGQQAAMIFVTGLFIEISPKQEGQEKQEKTLRTFTRSMVLVPVQNGDVPMQIHSDDLYITNVSPHGASWFRQENAAASSSSSSSSNRPAAVSLQQLPDSAKEAMVNEFAAKSNMNLQFSRRCLEEFQWDFDVAAAQFLQLKQEGKIPPAAFEPTASTA